MVQLGGRVGGSSSLLSLLLFFQRSVSHPIILRAILVTDMDPHLSTERFASSAQSIPHFFFCLAQLLDSPESVDRYHSFAHLTYSTRALRHDYQLS